MADKSPLKKAWPFKFSAPMISQSTSWTGYFNKELKAEITRRAFSRAHTSSTDLNL